MGGDFGKLSEGVGKVSQGRKKVLKKRVYEWGLQLWTPGLEPSGDSKRLKRTHLRIVPLRVEEASILTHWGRLLVNSPL